MSLDPELYLFPVDYLKDFSAAVFTYFGVPERIVSRNSMGEVQVGGAPADYGQPWRGGE